MTQPQGDQIIPLVRVFLDVDGVLNAVTGAPPLDDWTDWRKRRCMGFRITHSPSMGARLLDIASRPGVELRWLTTWEHNANEWIAPLFGWPMFDVIERRDLDPQASGLVLATSGWWKYDEVRAFYEEDGVPFVWIDDDLGDAYDNGAADWVASLNGAGLGISPHSAKGLTSRLLGEIESFIDGICGGSDC